MEDEAVADRIYEAALNSETWPGVLDDLSAMSNSDSGGILMFEQTRPFQYIATGRSVEVADVFVTQGGWQTSGRMPYFMRNPFTRFASSADYFPPHVEHDLAYAKAQQLGLEHQAGTFVPMSSGEFVVFVVNRRAGDGAYGAGDIANLDRVHAHLARAAVIASRLGLEKARAAVSLMEALSIPAAVLSSLGVVRACNSMFEQASPLLRPSAYGRLSSPHPPANALLNEALIGCRSAANTGVRSVPIPGNEEHPPIVVHVLPLRRSARDMFIGADILVAVSKVNPSFLVPAPNVLMGLFDLTPSEVRIASALAQGKSLRQAAAESGLTFSTARTYLDRIFRKTGVTQQSKLVALLKTAHSFGGEG